MKPQQTKASAIAHPNIALVKYWGKRDENLILPHNGSISITLGCATTKTTVEFSPAYKEDVIHFAEDNSAESHHRICTFLDAIRTRAGISLHAEITTTNSFPTRAGFASSAAGFAALAAAGAKAAGLTLTHQELSILARQGSGSAARSIPGGFVEWKRGEAKDGSDSFAEQIAPADHWPTLRCILISTDTSPKQLSSRAAMKRTVETSTLYQQRLKDVERRLALIKEAIRSKNFATLAEETIRESNNLHATLLDSWPPIRYLTDASWSIITAIENLNKSAGTPLAAYTFDAGPNPIILCEESNLQKILSCVEGIPGATLYATSRVGGPVTYT